MKDHAVDIKRILVAADWQLVNRRFYRDRVWNPARNMHVEVGSFANWMTAFEMVYDFDGCLFFPDGRLWRHQELTELFPDDANKWMSNFLKANADGSAPQAYSPKYDRLRIVELYCRMNAV
jgi:hypothetical protein